MNKTVLITGASSGIGLEFAQIFASKGDNLVLIARRKDLLEDFERKMKKKIWNHHSYYIKRSFKTKCSS